jgi:hypothetical protein
MLDLSIELLRNLDLLRLLLDGLLLEVACSELEPCEVNENLFQRCSCQLEVLNQALLLVLIQDLEHLAQFRPLIILSMT